MSTTPPDSPQFRPHPTKHSNKWSAAEVDVLVGAINAAIHARGGSVESLNWANIALQVQGRTGKQCREKYKNDLRPDLRKEPWDGVEEYKLARAHSQCGNQWAEIARFLPGRSENTIKNKWNATLRSKSDARSSTFLWTYARAVLDQGKVTSLETFRGVVEAYCRTRSPKCLEAVTVPEEYFAKGMPTSKAPLATACPVYKPKPARQPSRRPRARKRGRDMPDSDDEGEEEQLRKQQFTSSSEGVAGTAGDGINQQRRSGMRRSTAAHIVKEEQERQQQQQQQHGLLPLSSLSAPGTLVLPNGVPCAQYPNRPHQPGAAAAAAASAFAPTQPYNYPGATVLTDINLNLSHILAHEAAVAAGLKLHRDAESGKQHSSPAHPGSENQPPCSQQQQQGRSSLASAASHLHLPLLQSTPGMLLQRSLGSPRTAPWHSHLFTSPGMPSEGDFHDFLKDIGLDGMTGELGCSPAALRLGNRMRCSDASEQILPPFTIAKGRPSWLPEIEQTGASPRFSAHLQQRQQQQQLQQQGPSAAGLALLPSSSPRCEGGKAAPAAGAGGLAKAGSTSVGAAPRAIKMDPHPLSSSGAAPVGAGPGFTQISSLPPHMHVLKAEPPHSTSKPPLPSSSLTTSSQAPSSSSHRLPPPTPLDNCPPSQPSQPYTHPPNQTHSSHLHSSAPTPPYPPHHAQGTTPAHLMHILQQQQQQPGSHSLHSPAPLPRDLCRDLGVHRISNGSGGGSNAASRTLNLSQQQEQLMHNLLSFGGAPGAAGSTPQQGKRPQQQQQQQQQQMFASLLSPAFLHLTAGHTQQQQQQQQQQQAAPCPPLCLQPSSLLSPALHPPSPSKRAQLLAGSLASPAPHAPSSSNNMCWLTTPVTAPSRMARSAAAGQQQAAPGSATHSFLL